MQYNSRLPKHSVVFAIPPCMPLLPISRDVKMESNKVLCGVCTKSGYWLMATESFSQERMIANFGGELFLSHPQYICNNIDETIVRPCYPGANLPAMSFQISAVVFSFIV
ncbi:hypothetical protein Trydic_g22688 [Trypoxylus dichotomus]